ncbi:MAG TPA: cupredoxin domain-containing protein [Acidobacteriaceae bacterium]|nr:cupredoxin domain-containing protein [Acidobacteriaceae bacterium]
MKLLSAKLVLVAATALVGWPLIAQKDPAPTPGATATPARTITIQAKKYEFIPAEITLKKDQTVKLDLTSDDVEHSLEVPALGINSVMKKGEATEVEVTPTKTGDFKGKCGKFCGFGHRKMHFMVHVVN